MEDLSEDDEDLFQNLEKSYDKPEDSSKTIAEKIVEQTEHEFKSGFCDNEEISRDRQNEKNKINQELKKLSSSIHKYNNVRKSRLRAVNLERSKKRKEFRQRIEFLKLRLREINIEEEDPTSKKK